MKFFRNAVLGAMLFGAFAVSADDIYDNMIDTEAALKPVSYTHLTLPTNSRV